MMNFFASSERNFIGIECTMEAQTTVSNSTQCGLFTGEYKEYMVSGVTFSFNELYYYSTAFCRVQITPKTSTNNPRYLYSRRPV